MSARSVSSCELTDELPCGHRHGASDHAGNAGDEDFTASSTRRRDTNNQTGGGHNPVVRSQDSGAQPADSLGAVPFSMNTSRHRCVP